MNGVGRAVCLGMSVCVAVLTAAPAMCATYVVQPDGLGDYATIQDAVLNATDGDTIELTDGVFTGDGNRDIQVPSRPITIRSQSYDYMSCIVDCGGSARDAHRGFWFTSDVGTGDPTLQGIGIKNGYVYDGGAGIFVEGASPTIMSCAVAFCTVDNDNGKGGGLRVNQGGSPQVENCVFSENSAGYGGGVAVDGASGGYPFNDIRDNSATNQGGGVYIEADDLTVFSYCDISSNEAPQAGGARVNGEYVYLQFDNICRNEATSLWGGGVLLLDGLVKQCTLVENSSATGGGGIHSHAGFGTIDKCLVAFTESGYGIGATDGYAPTVSCCDVYGNVDGNYDSVVGDQTGINDNFSLNPEMCAYDAEDYRLSANSPCLPGSSTCGYLVGREGQGCDSPVEETTWGTLKAMWR